jgi:pyruvate kinase
MRAGMNVARLNPSHGTPRDHGDIIAKVRRIAQRLAVPVAVLIDLPGPKYRTGPLQEGSAILKRGARVALTTLPRGVQVRDRVLRDDGAMQLQVAHASGTDVTCHVIVGGTSAMAVGSW